MRYVNNIFTRPSVAGRARIYEIAMPTHSASDYRRAQHMELDAGFNPGLGMNTPSAGMMAFSECGRSQARCLRRVDVEAVSRAISNSPDGKYIVELVASHTSYQGYAFRILKDASEIVWRIAKSSSTSRISSTRLMGSYWRWPLLTARFTSTTHRTMPSCAR